MENATDNHKNTGFAKPPVDFVPQDFSLLDALPCAVYLIRDDPDLTLLHGNPRFYALLGCTPEEMQCQYANRLGALTETDLPLRGGNGHPAGFRQRIRRDGGGAWIDTLAVPCRYQGSPGFLCSSFDVTEDQRQITVLEGHETEVRLIAKQLKCDIFLFDPASGETRICNACGFLRPKLPGAGAPITALPRMVLDRALLYPGDGPVFQGAFDAVSQGESQVVCTFRMKTRPERYEWARMTLTALPGNPGRQRQVAGILENVTELKEMSAQYLSETQFYQALLTEKTAFAHVDVTEDRCTRFGGMWNLYNEIRNSKTYSDIIHEFINKVVHPDDRRHYLELMRRENFLQSLDNGIDTLGCEFRRIAAQNKMVWMGLQVHLFREPFTHHVLALLSITNIDALKKQPAALPYERPAAADPLSFESFLAEQGDMAYLVDPDSFNLICGNKAFYDRIGLTPGECIGVKCYEATQKRTSPCPFCSKANWSTDKFYLWRNMNTVLEQEFLIKNKLVPWRGAEALLAIAVDISNNKSIVDSMENGATECHSILSGIQRMAEAPDLMAAIESALETIGCFFRAGAVRFWGRKCGERANRCVCRWSRDAEDGYCEEGVDAWLQEQTWDQQILIESPEAMLCRSYAMYLYMKKNSLVNQRWVRLADGKQLLGFIGIENLSSNFQNTAFLESFLAYASGELKKRDLTEQALYATEHDGLTDLLSRASFERFIQEFCGDQAASVGVVVTNMDDLKGINSAKGFAAGSQCLKQFAGILKTAFPDEAAYRLNGDEFLVIAADIDRPGLEAGIQSLKVLMEENGAFTVSVGYSWDNVENDLAILIQQATEAMKVDKERRRGSGSEPANAGRRRMLREVVAALDSREFEVFLQPKVALLDRRVVGAEALVRYRRKDLGVVTPDKFIGVLEKNNLIRYIDLFVFEETCRILDRWKRMGAALPVISLNFSRLTLLERDILSSMEQIIGKYAVSREYLEIEITESVANMGKSILFQTALELDRAGFHISLDDFGTKYTNLSLLADINFSTLKLDKSLVGELRDRSSRRIILKNMICMCGDLGIDVLAEGIETQGQEAILQKLNCRLGQGYLYGKPMPVQEFYSRWLCPQ